MAPRATCCAARAISAVRLFTNSARPSSDMGMLPGSGHFFASTSLLVCGVAWAGAWASWVLTAGRGGHTGTASACGAGTLLVGGFIEGEAGAGDLARRGRVSGRGGRPSPGSQGRAGAATALLACARVAWALPLPKAAHSSLPSSACSLAMPSSPSPSASIFCVSVCRPDFIFRHP